MIDAKFTTCASQVGSRTARAFARQRGAASLIVVLMLFFVVALVAAYTSRNLIFEQRTSVNQYRSSMAFEAAEAGMQWAVAMLSAGRIGADCTEASAVAADTSFRQRYLAIDETSGLVTPRVRSAGAGDLNPTCVWDGAVWVCNCPVDAAPVVAAPAGNAQFPAFRVRFFRPTLVPGIVRLQVNGCVTMSEECLNDFGVAPRDTDGRAQHSTLLALKGAVTTPPAAALTVLGQVTGPSAAVVNNSHAAAGALTIHAASTIDINGLTLSSAPGTPGLRSLLANDTSLVPTGLTLADVLNSAPGGLNRNRVFGAVFGLMPDSYRLQPAAITYNCAAAGCRQDLANLVAANPGRVVWIPGDLVLESAGDIGSMPNAANPTVAGPVVLVVTGRLRFLTSGARIFGLVYAMGGDWVGSGEIVGAAFVESNLASTMAATVSYEQTVLDALRRSSGSFVQISGDWRDYR